MRVLICGPRDRHVSFGVIANTLASLMDGAPDVIINGGASGIDTDAHEYAKWAGIEPAQFKVSDEEWTRLGKRAGPMRNARMLREGKPDLVVAFRDRPTKGTTNMLKQANEAGVPAHVFNLGGK